MSPLDRRLSKLEGAMPSSSSRVRVHILRDGETQDEVLQRHNAGKHHADRLICVQFVAAVRG
jgi:hypothetical protein